MHPILLLLLHAIPVACIAWTVTHEEVFRELKEWCIKRSKTCKSVFERKFFYLFTCEYCFSHWVTIGLLLLTNFKLVYDDWLGYGMAFFSVVWVANIYMNLYQRVRVENRLDRAQAEMVEHGTSLAHPAPR